MSEYVSTINACKMCMPIGAALAFRGIDGCIPYIHGSQGCATYMRRYIISHFREPIDIASSSMDEKAAVHGGGPNFKKGILNVMRKYNPQLVGVATTCLTETIGEDVPRLVQEFREEFADLPLPEIVTASTPSYSGTHIDGWHAALQAVVNGVAQPVDSHGGVTLMPGFLSPADHRWFKELGARMGLALTLLPDFSDVLDGPTWETYQPLAPGGTPMEAIRRMAGACATVELGVPHRLSPAQSLEQRLGTPARFTDTPIGLRATDRFLGVLTELGGCVAPREVAARGRLLDALVDGHKYVFGKRVVVYGEEELAVGVTAFLAEMGARPVLVATGGASATLADRVRAVVDGLCPLPEVRTEADFHQIEEEANSMEPDFLVGHSKGYKLARSRGIPLIRLGFPIHDRFGGQRLLCVGYDGALELYDRIVNALLAQSQDASPVGYWYL
ncbi:nitrogenase component 1 [Thermodesulfomicrobium sp. WS]|uniref:nitrogenase component 1 n=1 Tax=Thermodesulfomicrobium sp. WS TaxID=3004129 RepID=UPI0024902741|nr:nitrogenase component 1 [Thermodesulfomicrobium sp. WS]